MTLWLCVQSLLAEQESAASSKGHTLTEQILVIMETILTEASAHLEPQKYKVTVVLVYSAQFNYVRLF